MLNKYALKELAMIRLIAEKGREQDAYAAGARFLAKAGGCEASRKARFEALEPFLPKINSRVAGRHSDGSMAAIKKIAEKAALANVENEPG